MLKNREHIIKYDFVVRLVLLVICVSLLVGCGSRLNTRVNSIAQDTEPKVALLEETPMETPATIMVPHALENENPSMANQAVNFDPDESLSNQPAEPFSVGPQGDVFASSGKASEPIAVTIPKSTPIPSLAKPSDTQGLPFTLSDIFFDYDQYMLQEGDRKTLEMNAQVLLGRYAKKKVLIQGHCDERGTEEYNLALGVRRAQAVKDYLVDLGVPPENVGVLSYGKEKPFCTQHSWNCWKHNRRSHFVFQ